MKKPSQFMWVEDDNGQKDVDEWQPPVKQIKKTKTNKTEFVGWGSKQLIDFLASISVDTASKLSQEEVRDMVYKYISANNLINPSRKKRVICDEKLHMLFGRKTVGRVKISDLLERHFAENQENSAFDDDAVLYSSDEDASVTPKRKSVSSAERRTHKKAKEEPASNDSCFAEVIPENIKLVYLRKSLVQELSKDLETFEVKVAGTFVRVKSDPHDFTQKNYYQLVRVTGINKPTGTEGLEKQPLLKVCNLCKDISITMLSDDDFSKEECEDLLRRIKEGLLDRLTVVEMQQKAQTLHQDITKHWIKSELVRLQNRIDHANEKGWRRELSDYIDRRMFLQTPSEQTRLLQESPKVIAEKIVPEPTKEATPEPKEKIVPETAKNDYLCFDSDAEDDDWFDSFLKIAEESRAKASTENGLTTTADPAPAFKPEFPAAEDHVQQENTIDEGDALSPSKVFINEGNQDAMHNYIVIARHEPYNVESTKSGKTVSIPNGQLIIPGMDTTAESIEANSSLPKLDGKLPSPFANLKVTIPDLESIAALVADDTKQETPVSNGTRVIPAVIELSDDEDNEANSSLPKLDGKLPSPFANLKVSIPDLESSADLVADDTKRMTPVSNGTRGIPAIIELSDDEDEECTSSLFCDQPDSPIWQYMDPQGAVQGPFSLLSMKRWTDANYFPPGFMIWKKGIPDVKYPLAEVLGQSFSNHIRSC